MMVMALVGVVQRQGELAVDLSPMWVSQGVTATNATEDSFMQDLQ